MFQNWFKANLLCENTDAAHMKSCKVAGLCRLFSYMLTMPPNKGNQLQLVDMTEMFCNSDSCSIWMDGKKRIPPQIIFFAVFGYAFSIYNLTPGGYSVK